MFNVKVADMQHTPNSLKQLEIKKTPKPCQSNDREKNEQLENSFKK